MAKFLVLYNSTVTATEVMANATPEEVQASMAEWIQWREAASKQAKIDFGLPLQAVGRVTSAGETDSDTQVSGYSIVEAESKDIVLELLKSHPHVQREGNSIDVLEMLSMPELDA